MKARLIINPISGTQNKDGLEDYVRQELAPLNWDIEAMMTKAHGDATRFAREAVELGYDAVLAAGGDGTINEVASTLCGSRTALGIIPCGSGNGLARHLGIPIDIREGVKNILKEKAHPIDYATVNNKKFFCTFGVGFDAAVSAAFAQKPKRGKLTYIQSTFETYAKFSPEHYTIRANGQVITEKAFLIAVCNASQYGNNAYIAPQATIDDGLLDVTIIHAGNPLATALVGFDILAGNIEKNFQVHTFRCRSLEIQRTKEGCVHLDGEPMELGKKLEIECHQGKLWVFSPMELPKFTPFLTPAQAMVSDFRIAVNKLFKKH